MRNSKYSRLIIGGEDYSQYFTFPFMVQRALDETLDFAVVELPLTKRKEPFEPFTPVEIGAGEHAMSFIVAMDDVEEKIGANRYKHTVTVMEYTKETERILCGAKAFTHPLVRDYTDGQTYAVGLQVRPTELDEDFFYFGQTTIDDPIRGSLTRTPIANNGVLSVYSDFGISQMAHAQDTYTVDLYFSKTNVLEMELDGNGKETGGFEIVGQKIWSTTVPSVFQGLIANVDISAYGEGQYFLLYRLTLNLKLYIATQIQVARAAVEAPLYTYEDVVNVILDTAETIRDGLDVPRYRLRYKSEAQRKKFQEIAPEFRFANGRSLWECLREIGQCVHAIPRAIHDLTDGLDYIEFDELGGTDRADMSKGIRYGGESSVTVGDYTAGLESLAANLVNLDDEDDGSVSEPFGGGYMSLRAATDEARITEGTGIIKTTHAIEKIIKVELGEFTVDNKTYPGGDITPYIFEKSEYDLLSNFEGQYPSSKTYAIFYTQGSHDISGLWYKAQDAPIAIANAAKQYSIVNILELATGVNIGYFDGLKSIFDSEDEKERKSLKYPDLMFRVTYIPSVTARVRNYKPTYSGGFPSVLAHNQSANKLSALAFGENLRGQLAMMSSSSDTVMYLFKRLEDIPDPGTLYDDDNYISSVTARVYHDYVLANIALSTGYNELGSRVEINNAIRQFEIPAAEDRYTILEEFCEIGKKTADDPDTALTDALKAEVLRAFDGQAGGKDVSLAEVVTYDEDGRTLTEKALALPVISLALGTSLYFGWRFEDNFAAGSKSATGESGYRIQEYVPYGDPFYSRAYSVGFKLITGAQPLYGALPTAHDLPEITGIAGGTAMVDTGAHPVIWYKDSADAGCLSYQLHYVTNDGLIIGDGIAYHCAAVRETQMVLAAQIYFYDHRINQLTGTTDERDFIATYLVKVDTENNRLTYDGKPEGFQSWAIIKNGRFMLGKNSTEAPKEIYFNFKRRFTT